MVLSFKTVLNTFYKHEIKMTKRNTLGDTTCIWALAEQDPYLITAVPPTCKPLDNPWMECPASAWCCTTQMDNEGLKRLPWDELHLLSESVTLSQSIQKGNSWSLWPLPQSLVQLYDKAETRMSDLLISDPYF